MQSFFITGTDTEVGKTFFTASLLSAQAAAGRRVAGYKPVSAGCELINNERVNEDAWELWQASNIGAPLQHINPIALMPPIAPHIAAAEAGMVITEHAIVDGYQQLCDYAPDLLLMEGAGGWQLPLGNGLWMPQIVQRLQLPVIMVVGMRLGCLNHAMLTAQAIEQTGLTLHGWVANQLTPTPMPYYDQNLATLQQSLSAPMLAELPYSENTSGPVSVNLTQILV